MAFRVKNMKEALKYAGIKKGRTSKKFSLEDRVSVLEKRVDYIFAEFFRIKTFERKNK